MNRKMTRQAMLIGLIAGVALAAGCSRTAKKDQILFEGQAFRAKSAAVDKKLMLADFTVTIDGVSASLDGAREAGRYEGTRYCIANYGTSSIDWQVGPDTDPAQLRVVDNRLTFRGTCERP